MKVYFICYRYDNGAAATNTKRNRNFHSKVIIGSIFLMSVILCALVYVFVASRFVETSKISKTVKVLEFPETTTNKGIEIVEISGQNESQNPPRRIKRLDSEDSDSSPDSQKLIFFPGREMKPPKRAEKPRVVPANHRMSSRTAEPRPFNHMTGGPRPNGFQVQPMSTARSFHNQQFHNIHEIINQNQQPYQGNPKQQRRIPKQNQYFETSSNRPIQLAGTYRHPRKNGDLKQMFQGNQRHQSNLEIHSDPFHNFKPNSPYEINQMIINGLHTTPSAPTKNPYFRRKYKQQIASIPNYNLKSKDVSGIYQNILSSGKKIQVDRNEVAKQKPYQLMLDVYPMGGEEGEMNQMNPLNQMNHLNQMNPLNQINHQMQHLQQMHAMPQLPRMPRLKPFQGYYQDPNFFNAMNYPQLMPRYPAIYRYHQPHAEASNIHPVGINMKPSQLVVHLNLYPKNRSSNKRSSTEIEKEIKKVEPPKVDLRNNSLETTSMPLNINFNVNTGNGHPENIHHHVNLPRDPYHNYTIANEPNYKSNYYYDENEDNQSLVAAPSLVYQNIQRDRPIHMMLRNTTTENPKNKLKNHNHKHTYQTIERPRKQSIKNEPRNFLGIQQ